MPPVDRDLLQLSALILSLLMAATAGMLLALDFISKDWLIHVVMRACALAAAIIQRVPRKAALAAVVAGSVVAARWLSSEVLSSRRQTNKATFYVEDVIVTDMEAVTDAGTKIPLYHSRFYGAAVEVSRYIVDMEAEQGQVIELYAENPACNCHGWVFTGGQFALRNFDVSSILRDHAYFEVLQVEANDLAAYFDGDRVTHTGVVRMVDPSGLILLESKWGPYGVYLHPPDRQPFAGKCRYFRTNRASHQLTIQAVARGEEEKDIVLTAWSCRVDGSLAP